MNAAHLGEMLVERKRRGDFQALHQNEARTVSKAPLFVLVGAKDLPGLLHVFLAQMDKLGKLLVYEPSPSLDRGLYAEPGLYQCENFVHDIVAGDKTIAILSVP